MPLRRFVVIVLPARDTRLGTLAADTGCLVQMLARAAPGGAYDIEFEAKAVPGSAAHQAAEDLGDLVAFTYNHVESERLEWRGAARVPVSNVASRTCRALAQAGLDSGPAWFVFDAGFAELRLEPSHDASPQVLMERARRILGPLDTSWDMYEADLDATWFDEACQGLRRPMLV